MDERTANAGPTDRLGSLRIDYRAPSELRPARGNAKAHPKRQIEQIVASMRAFGVTNPILVDEAGVIVCGHGRWLACKALGLEHVPVIVIAGLSEIERRALRLADNKIAANGTWDTELLRSELLAISAPDLEFDVELTGFSVGEIDVALAGGKAGDPDDEVVPAVPARPVTRPGDIWRLGPHKVMCGDTRDRAALAALMEGPADAAFLDPPFNVKIDGNAVAKGRHAGFAMADGEMTSEEFIAFLVTALGSCASVSRPGAVHFVCMDHRHVGELCAAGQQVYGARLNICVWRKSNAGMGSLYRSQHELVFVFRVGDAAFRNNVELGRHGRHRTNVWDYPSVNSLKGARRYDLALHPTVKPLGLVADAVMDVTRRGDLVLDGFLGSGTSLLAAERTGRRCVGVEYEPRYVDIALERWSQMTGETPVHARTGDAFADVRRDRLGGQADD